MKLIFAVFTLCWVFTAHAVAGDEERKCFMKLCNDGNGCYEQKVECGRELPKLRCYKLISSNKSYWVNWTMANSRCESIGGILAEFTDDYSFEYVQQNVYLGWLFWVGGKKHNKGREFFWNSGKLVNRLPRYWSIWKGIQNPSYGPGEICMTWLYQKGWDDTPCRGNNAYLCQKDRPQGGSCNDWLDDYDQERNCIMTLCTEGKGCYEEKVPCGREYPEFRCYRINSTAQMNRHEADAKCLSMGGHLAEFTDQYSFDYVQQYVWEKKIFHIGGTDQENEDSWVWNTTGKPVNINKWSFNNPSGGRGPNCMTWWKEEGWDDDLCRKKYGYLCQKDRPHAQGGSCDDWLDESFQGCDQGWLQNARSKSCYKYFYGEDRKDYKGAKWHCTSMGGHIAMPKTKEENLFLSKNKPLTNGILLGLTAIMKEGIFTWDDGSEPNWQYWDSGQPRKSDGNCIAMNDYNSKWNVISCSSVMEYFCEKKQDLLTGSPVDVESGEQVTVTCPYNPSEERLYDPLDWNIHVFNSDILVAECASGLEAGDKCKINIKNFIKKYGGNASIVQGHGLLEAKLTWTAQSQFIEEVECVQKGGARKRFLIQVYDKLSRSKTKRAFNSSWGFIPGGVLNKHGDEVVIKGILRFEIWKMGKFSIIFNSKNDRVFTISIKYFKVNHWIFIFDRILLFLDLYKDTDGNKVNIKNLLKKQMFLTNRRKNDYSICLRVQTKRRFGFYIEGNYIGDVDVGVDAKVREVSFGGDTFITDVSVYKALAKSESTTTLKNNQMPFIYNLSQTSNLYKEYNLTVGDKIEFRGRPNSKSGQFILDIGKDCCTDLEKCQDDPCSLTLLRINVKYDASEIYSYVQISHQKSGSKMFYLKPVKEHSVSFWQDEPYSLKIILQQGVYLIIINNKLYDWIFYYDDPSIATHFIFRGDTTLDSFNFTTPKRKFSLRQQYLNDIDSVETDKEKEKVETDKEKETSIWKDTRLFWKPEYTYDVITEEENATVPFQHKFDKPLLEGDQIYITGVPTSESGRFVLEIGNKKDCCNDTKKCHDNECPVYLLKIDVTVNNNLSFWISTMSLIKGYSDGPTDAKFTQNQPYIITITLQEDSYCINYPGDMFFFDCLAVKYFARPETAIHFIVRGDTTLNIFRIRRKEKITPAPTTSGSAPLQNKENKPAFQGLLPIPLRIGRGIEDEIVIKGILKQKTSGFQIFFHSLDYVLSIYINYHLESYHVPVFYGLDLFVQDETTHNVRNIEQIKTNVTFKRKHEDFRLRLKVVNRTMIGLYADQVKIIDWNHGTNIKEYYNVTIIGVNRTMITSVSVYYDLPEEEAVSTKKKREVPFKHIFNSRLLVNDCIIVRGEPTAEYSEYGKFTLNIGTGCKDDNTCILTNLRIEAITDSYKPEDAIIISHQTRRDTPHIFNFKANRKAKVSFKENKPYVVKIILASNGFVVHINDIFIDWIPYNSLPSIENFVLTGNTTLKTFEVESPRDKLSVIPRHFGGLDASACAVPKADIVVVFSGGGMTQKEIYRVKAFVKDLFDCADIESGKIRAGVLFGQREIGFIKSTNTRHKTSKWDFFAALDDHKYKNEIMKPVTVLKLLTNYAFRSNKGFDRRDAPNYAIVVSGEVSTKQSSRTEKWIQRVRKMGIHITTVGVGLGNPIDLSTIATNPYKNSLNIKNYGDLRFLKNDLVESGCIYLPKDDTLPLLKNPTVPFHFELKKRLQIGDMIRVKGLPTFDTRGFNFTLGQDCCSGLQSCNRKKCDKTLVHVEVDFQREEKTRISVLIYHYTRPRSKVQYQKSPSTRKAFYFKSNKEYIFEIIVQEDGYYVYFDDYLYDTIKIHRNSHKLATHFLINGKTKLTEFTMFSKEAPKPRLPEPYVLKQPLVPGTKIIIKGVPTHMSEKFSIRIGLNCQRDKCSHTILLVDIMLRPQRKFQLSELDRKESNVYFKHLLKYFFPFKENHPFEMTIVVSEIGYNVTVNSITYGQLVRDRNSSYSSLHATHIVIGGDIIFDGMDIQYPKGADAVTWPPIPTTNLPTKPSLDPLDKLKVPYIKKIKFPLAHGDKIIVHGVPKDTSKDFQLVLGKDCCTNSVKCHVDTCSFVFLYINVEFKMFKNVMKVSNWKKRRNGRRGPRQKTTRKNLFKKGQPYVITIDMANQNEFHINVDKQLHDPLKYPSRFPLATATEFFIIGGTYLTDVKVNDATGEEKGSPAPKKNTELCGSLVCTQASVRIRQNLDETVNPCDDFYRFSCGGWMDRTRIPSIEKEWSVGQKEYMGVFDQVEFILQGENNPDDPPPYNYIRDVYKSCMDMEAIDAESRDQDVKDWLRTNIGEWPLLNDTSDEEPFNLTKALINSNRYGTSPIIDMWVAADKKNSTVNILYMDKPDLGMGWGSNSLYKQNGTDLMAYETYIYEVAKTLGFANSSTAKADVADIVDFEIQLAEISGNEEKSRDPNDMYNPMTLADVHGNYSSDKFNFEIFFKGIMGLPGIGVDVTDSEIIINEFPLYFQNLTQLFKQTPIKTIANYVMWIFTQTLIDDLREEIRDHKFQYLKVREQVQGKRTRGFTCTEFFFANKNLQMAIGKPFVERYSNRDAKILGHEMLVKIKEAFIELMYTLDWMDEDTRKLSREKLKFMKDKIGYPDYLDNVTFYTKLYENYTFKSEGFFENRLVVVQQYTIEKLKVLRRPVDKTKWPNGPTIVNGYQDNSKNEIIVLSAFFQPPFFSAEYPMYLNYGGIGVTIAHEVSHSFDNTGRKYDKYGNLKEMWTEDMIEKYENVSQCMKDQYGAFYSHEANESLNADVMMREIVGDNGGLRQSFRAYRDWVTSRGQEERLLFGVNYTQNQLFFIQQAQFLCQKYRPKVYAERFKVSYHPPAPFRVWGMVQNSVDFAKAFNCPSGSPMSSVHKCTVW